MTKLRSTLIVVLMAGAAVAAASASAGGGTARPSKADPRGVAAQSPNPLAGVRFYVDPNAPSNLQWQAYRRSGQERKAALVWKIAREPKSLWLGRFTRPNFNVKVRRLIDPARAQGAVPIFTVLRAEATGCSPTYQGGGPAGDAATRNWYDDLARAIGGDRVVIALRAGLARHDRLPGPRAAATTAFGCSATAWTRSRSCRTPRSTWRPAPPTGRARSARPSS